MNWDGEAVGLQGCRALGLVEGGVASRFRILGRSFGLESPTKVLNKDKSKERNYFEFKELSFPKSARLLR